MRKSFKTFLIFLVTHPFATAKAQSFRYPIALPYIGVSAYSLQQNDAFSFTGNQGALAGITEINAGIYSERRFLLEALNTYAAAVAFPTKFGNVGLSLNYAGFKNFNENKVGLAYGRRISHKIDIGVQFNYYGYRVPAYANASAINFEAGLIMHFTQKFNGGFYVYNPVGGKLGKSGNEKLPAVYKTGFGYDASDHFFIGAELIKEEDKPVNVTASMQYQLSRKFFARVGFLSESTMPFAGFGIGFSNLRVDISASYHQQLGFSPGILLVTNFGNHKE